MVDGFILPERDLLRDKEETSSAGQRQVTSTPNEPQFLCFCGTSLSLESHDCLRWGESQSLSGDQRADRRGLGAVVDLSEADIDDVIDELEDALVLEP